MSPFSPIIFFKNLVLEEVNPHMFLTTIGVQGGEVRGQGLGSAAPWSARRPPKGGVAVSNI